MSVRIADLDHADSALLEALALITFEAGRQHAPSWLSSTIRSAPSRAW